VSVYNRTDCCTDRLRDFYVLTSDRPFASTDLQRTLRQPGVTAIRVRNIGTDKSVDLRGTARYVRIQSALTGYLPLAEVQIYGTDPLTQPNVAEHIRTNQFGMFIHYGPGTYTNEQWTTPRTSPSVFNPTALDTDQWAEDGRPPAGLTEPVQMSDMISTSNWDWFNTDQSLPPRTTEDIVAEETYQRDHGYQYLPLARRRTRRTVPRCRP
jgi:hypothetical protein